MPDEGEKENPHCAGLSGSEEATEATSCESTLDHERDAQQGTEKPSENEFMNPNRRWKREELYEERLKRWK